MKKIFISIITFIILLFSFNCAFGNVEISINLHQVKESKGTDNENQKEEIEDQIFVDLGEEYFSYSRNEQKIIFDLLHKRMYTIDLSKNKISNDSLFANIGFRVYEFQNRLMLAGALEAGGVKDNPMLPVMSEHLFSLTQKDKKSKLLKKSQDNTIVYSSDGKELMSYSKRGEVVTRKSKESFVKYFRYVYGGHPVILEKLLSDNIIPKTIRIHRYNVVNEISTLTISKIKITPQTNFSLEGYSTEDIEKKSAPILNYLNRLKYTIEFDFEETLKKLLSRAMEYYEAGNYLDTMLVYLEYYLSSSRPFPRTYQEQARQLKLNEDVKLLLESLSPKSKEEAEKFIAILQKLEKRSKHQGHIIKIFKANILEGLGNQNDAKRLFFESLEKSPHITGAYKDLGDIYYKEYNTIMAWNCWDIARKINPKHKMLIQVNEFESKLLRDHPDFF